MVSIGKWLMYGLVGAFALSALIDPARAQGTIGAFSGVGTALGSLGGGIQSLLTGTGVGVSKLFNPLFTLRDLIYGPQAGAQVNKDIYQTASTSNLSIQQTPAQQMAIELDPAAPFTPITTGFGGTPAYGSPPTYTEQKAEQGAAEAANTTLEGFSYTPQNTWYSTIGVDQSPLSQVTVHNQTYPMSEAAIEYYQALGVTVSPSSNQTVSSQNSSNGGGVSSASANYVAGAAQALGYSTGQPTD